MKIIYTRHSLTEEINNLREQSLSIGFVPTMGALHKGHFQLLKTARKENHIVICSIFVNPVQFNSETDLEQYPRNIEQDIVLAESYCDILFIPSVEEMYPMPPQEEFHFGLLASTMEGAYRPGHFNGVAIVVKRLFELVQPAIAYFGIKDFQQLAIINQLVYDYDMKILIRSIDTVREEDGLAMSSRNRLLSPQARSIAPFIWQTLQKAQLLKKEKSPREISNWIREQFNGHKSFTLEYAQLVDAETLEEVNEYQEGESIVACVAVWLDKVRLIDNIMII